MAKKLGQILSPVRPITIVSGPELMDKFVEASEANLRASILETQNLGGEMGNELQKSPVETI